MYHNEAIKEFLKLSSQKGRGQQEKADKILRLLRMYNYSGFSFLFFLHEIEEEHERKAEKLKKIGVELPNIRRSQKMKIRRLLKNSTVLKRIGQDFVFKDAPFICIGEPKKTIISFSL